MNLDPLVASIRCDGWTVTVTGNLVRVARTVLPEDTRRPGRPVTFDYADHFHVYPNATAADVIRRVFATIQYLTDHELREQFTVAGHRVFEPHTDPPITGHQKDWWVEAQSAVDGYAIAKEL